MPLIVIENFIYDVTDKELREINLKKKKIGFASSGGFPIASTFLGLEDFKHWLYAQSYKKVGKVSFNDSNI